MKEHATEEDVSSNKDDFSMLTIDCCTLMINPVHRFTMTPVDERSSSMQSNASLI
jgi:hypothetical protein